MHYALEDALVERGRRIGIYSRNKVKWLCREIITLTKQGATNSSVPHPCGDAGAPGDVEITPETVTDDAEVLQQLAGCSPSAYFVAEQVYIAMVRSAGR
jgi:hypothetical protein